MKGRVARILSSSFIDGPGHRAVVFLQGCDFRCLYCHNPETQRLCDSCGLCLEVCPAGALKVAEDGRVLWNETACQACDACIRACPRFSSPRVLELEPEELSARIRPLSPFLDGLTFSGGECGLQPDFLIECADLLHGMEGASGPLSVFADSNAGESPEVFGRLISALDGFLLDLKAFTEESHRRLTGAPLGPVLRNIEAAAEAGKLIELRTVLIKGLNDSEGDLEAAASRLVRIAPLALYRLIPFRPEGVRGSYASLEPYPRAELQRIAERLRPILGQRLRLPLLP